MIIRIVGHEGQSSFPFGENDAWSEFKKTVEGRGHIIETGNYGHRIDALIAHNHSKSAIRESLKSDVPKSRRALVIWEPRIVDEKRYLFRNLNKYGSIFAASKNWAQEINGVSFYWPQTKSKFIPDFSFNWWKTRDRIVMIQGNKFSAHKFENYSLRRKILREGISQDLSLDLYGVGWNKGFFYDFSSWFKSLRRIKLRSLSAKGIFGMGYKYANYLGSPSNKFEVLRSYKVSIVIENSSDFVSEKLFDSVFSGCLTFYIGPDLVNYGIQMPLDTIGGQCMNSNLEKINHILNLAEEEQRSLAKAQYDELLRILPFWESTQVLTILAKNILDIIERV